jgi:hypothetical protein
MALDGLLRIQRPSAAPPDDERARLDVNQWESHATAAAVSAAVLVVALIAVLLGMA